MLKFVFKYFLFFTHVFAYFWPADQYFSPRSRETPSKNTPSNLGCFLCSQLLSVTKHRVGLSENQLRNQLYEKCRVLPNVLKEQCFAFIESSLPEIYYSINYDISAKDMCIQMKFCDESNPFASGEREEYINVPSTSPAPEMTTTSATVETITNDRIGHSNVLEILLPKKKTEEDKVEDLEQKRLTCAFCERMLENAKNYAVTSKADITNFANNACASLPKGSSADECYQMADKRISELAKFVDSQVVDALWCAEQNHC